jgi:hypothetical protein
MQAYEANYSILEIYEFQILVAYTIIPFMKFNRLKLLTGDACRPISPSEEESDESLLPSRLSAHGKNANSRGSQCRSQRDRSDGQRSA